MPPFAIPRSRWTQTPDGKKKIKLRLILDVKLMVDNKRAKRPFKNNQSKPSTSLRHREKYYRFSQFIVHITFSLSIEWKMILEVIFIEAIRPLPDVIDRENKTDHNTENTRESVHLLRSQTESAAKTRYHHYHCWALKRTNWRPKPSYYDDNLLTAFSIMIGNLLPTTFIYLRNAGLW